MPKLPPMTRAGKRAIKAMLQRKDAEGKMLELLLGDSKQIMEFNLGYSKELGARGAHPAERIIAHNAAQLAVLADWLALLTKSTMMRL
jgi:hypothetical protein